MVNLLSQTHESLTGLASGLSSETLALRAKLLVYSHSKLQSKPAAADAGSFVKKVSEKLLREPVPVGAAEVLGYRFRFSENFGWNFRSFNVPLWASAPALGLLVYLASLWKGDNELSQWLPAEPAGEYLVWAAFVALGILTALAVQGAVVIHARLKPLAGLFSVLFVLVLVSALKGGAFTLIAILAALGLLDNAYDFRKRLAKSENAV
jgi:hypothetical protein